MNRNFGYQWKQNKDCTSGFGHGPEPWSETETRNVRDFILARKGDWVVYDSVHSFSELVLLPWQYSKTEKPENYEELESIAMKGVEAMKKFGHNYKVSNIS